MNTPRQSYYKYNDTEDFASKWQDGVNSQHRVTPENITTGVIADGKGSLGTPQKRQDALSGAIINAAIMTSVFERLKSGSEFDSVIHNLNTIEMDVEQFDALRQSVEKAQENSDMTGLFNAVCALRDNRLIPYHRDLVSDDKWNGFTEKRIDDDMVTDPRVDAALPYVDDYFTLKNSGEKTQKSIERKINKNKKKAFDKKEAYNIATDIRDTARMRVGVESPEVMTDFIFFLEHAYPAKEIAGYSNLYPRVHVEEYEAKKHGLFDRTLYVAMDHLHDIEKNGDGGDMAYQAEDGRHYLKGLNGMVAEVRVIPKHMEKYEDITHPVNAVYREIDDLREEKGEAGFSKILEVYYKQRGKFEAQKEMLGSEYMFPDAPTREIINNDELYSEYVDQFLTLNHGIFMEQLSSDELSDEWKELVVKTRLKDLHKNEDVNTQVQNEDLQRIVPSQKRLAELAKEVKADVYYGRGLQ